MKTKLLLLCGLLSSAMYVVINTFVPLGFEGYSYASHTVSELSAVGAETRWLWVPLAVIYITLFALFAFGIRAVAGDNRNLRIVSTLMIIYSVINIYWPPMHMRGDERSITDTLHLVWAGATVLLMILIMAFGSQALGKNFGVYTILSIVTHIVFGYLTSLEAPNINDNLPTPWIGVWERINIAVFMLWIAVLSLTLIRKYPTRVHSDATTIGRLAG
jgi:hypothetical protein